MVSNRLKLNPSKTELMWFRPKHGLEKLLLGTVNINFVAINPVKSAKSLGVAVDHGLKLVNHIATVCRSSHTNISAS